uniref:Uncharacterized protein n=1 Tax=Crocodylus porosus TaxID=8502 RepID=A0A7M4F108_CROPO
AATQYLLHITSVLVLASTKEMQYVLMVPSVLQNDSPYQICLQFLNLNESVFVSIVLEYNAVNTTIFDQIMKKKDAFQCTTFTVPPATSSPLAFITFSAMGPTVRLLERRSVAIQNMDSIVFIQTDKPIYKPGQTGGHVLCFT